MIAKRTIKVSRWNRLIEAARKLDDDVHWALIDAPDVVATLVELPFAVLPDIIWAISPKATLASDKVEII